MERERDRLDQITDRRELASEEEPYAKRLSGLEVHLLGTDAEAAHAQQALAQSQQLLRQLSAAPLPPPWHARVARPGECQNNSVEK